MEPEVVNEEFDNAEAASNVITENPPFKRVCRHMGITESSQSCEICKLVSLFFWVNSKKTYTYKNIVNHLFHS